MSPGLSRRELDCVEAVYSLSSNGWPARVKDVAGRMRVTPPTAVQFLAKLIDTDLVEKGPSGYKLTKSGVECLNGATRTHRIFETLLVRNGFPLEDACKVSSSLTGTIDETALEKLCSHMSHPDKCPHGMPIPGGAKHV
ncbi:MAG: metal-dependent transcriptional regulator [Nitrososphaerota archaeon]|jgi:Mn-dependent DtxR family transcriptional regulator|nr:metal-dependent transcriptional regulator [Nitrososphaerota archaeon]MDG6953080.1 metal-dependent transcriptional regulator [Nitrososphaerota archaeon]MDG6955707.1 metal-dependent transcriptional regulator [Nitrososphaerota archaeon]MDG6960060.1 metal-dependent transcriptional regulator [Nitrososphaerota archaeon]MDG6965078.1 metal-dependent transcriptional regulator [Nitrososphaerota archaeon]